MLIGAEVIAAQPDRTAEVMAAFTRARREPMRAAMRSMMLRRPGLEAEAASLRLPVLMFAAHGDGMGSGPDDIRDVAATMPDARVVEVAGAGHLAPLFIDVDTIHDRLLDFWVDAQEPGRSLS
ncbi:alpha/beta fold hydrolase [Mycolicibacterium brumae]|uniref:alpha/beta fold hydrolase n=1 Tax=Mycolicibacterium brumae TaxID=85968 RepID=UPI001F43E953|nr:hypothetical protein [Mycolicibacterium brumae]UWW09162.1 hypothetical protein L2Z93_002248 [Mycolicibacterium brumae]